MTWISAAARGARLLGRRPHLAREAILAVEGKPTGDGRLFEVGAIRWRTPADLNRGVGRAHEALARRLTRVETAYARALRSLGAMVAAALTDQATAAAWEGPTPEALTAELRRQLEAEWLGRHTGTIERVRAEAWRVTIAELTAALGVSFGVSNPVLEGAYRAVVNRTDLSDQAWRLVTESLQGSYDEGRGIPDAARALRTHVAGVAPVRSRAIARTELIGLSNAGSLAAARLTGAAEWKQWLATNDDRTRDTHRAASGQVRRLDDTFTVGGYTTDYPGGPGLPAGEVVNCRCTVIYTDDPEGYDGEVGAAGLLASALTVGSRACGGHS